MRIDPNDTVERACIRLGLNCLDTLLEVFAPEDGQESIVDRINDARAWIRSSGILHAGQCLNGGLAYLVALAASNCVYDDGDKISVVVTGGLGLGYSGLSITAGKIISNAKPASQLDGHGLCVGLGVSAVIPPGIPATGEIEGCLSIKAGVLKEVSSITKLFDRNSYSGTFTVYIGVGLGVGGATVGGHAVLTDTQSIEMLDYPDHLGPLIGVLLPGVY
jgi:hypothetical protein